MSKKKVLRSYDLEAPAPVEFSDGPTLVPDGLFMPHPSYGVEVARAKQAAEVDAQWAWHDRYRLEDPQNIAADLIVDDDLELRGSEAALGKDVPPAPAEPFAAALQEAATTDPYLAKNIASLAAPAPAVVVLDEPADPVLQNGLGQAMIHYRDPTTGLEKVKGYTRVTTYIDGLDDKTTLTKWKQRTLLEGGAVELLQNDGDSPSLQAVARSVQRTDVALADIDTRERVEQELLGLKRVEVLKEHRDNLERIAEDLMELGGAHEKANKGTNLHRLTELVDTGHDLPADTTASDRRDVAAYQAKMLELGVETLWCERRVVLDDIQVSGTMDRAYRLHLPGRKNRVRVVGDLKTGSVAWGAGKIGMQLALYSRGLGYDWTKPLERVPLALSKALGLLVHLPQGEGRCEVYVVDLELAGKGLDLARQVREWRRDGKRVYDLKKALTAG